MYFLNKYIFFAFSVYPFLGFITYTKFDAIIGNILGAFLYLSLLLICIDADKNERRISLPIYLKLFLLFVIITIIADIANNEIENLFKYMYLNKYIKSFLVLFVIENTRVKKSDFKKIRLLFLYVFISSVFIFFIQVFFDPSFFVRPEIGFKNNFFSFDYRYPSIFSWTGSISFGFSIPIMISIIASENHLKKKGKINYFLYIIGATMAFLHKARWVMLSIFVVMYQAIFYSKKKSVTKYVVIVILITFATYQVLIISKINVKRIINERIIQSQKGGFTEGSAGSRLLAFKMFAKFFPEKPILGTGGIMSDELIRDLRDRSSQIHVGFLSLFYYYGLVGGVIYIAFLYHLFRRLKITAEKSNYWGSYFAWLTFIAANLTLVSLDIFKMGLIISMIFHKHYEQHYVEGDKILIFKNSKI